MPNLYEILKIEKDATQDEIKWAFYELAKRFHPDKNPTTEAAEKFKKIAFAYSIISNQLTRVTYDTHLANNDTVVLSKFYENGQMTAYVPFNTFFTAAFLFSINVNEILRQQKNKPIQARAYIEAKLHTLLSEDGESRLEIFRNNKDMLYKLYDNALPDDYLAVTRVYPIAELIEVLKGPQSPLKCLIRQFRADRCFALLERLSPEQRWSILQELSYQPNHYALSTLIERHQNCSGLYSYNNRDILKAMVLSPNLYFDEFDQQIEALEASSDLNANKLASALRVLQADLIQDVRKQEKNNKSLSEIQYSTAMQTLRATISMVRAVQLPAEAVNAVKRYEEFCASAPPSTSSRVMANVIIAAVGLAIGALIGLAICSSMGVAVIPLAAIVAVAALSAALVSERTAKITGAYIALSSSLSKFSLFQPQFKHQEDEIILSAREYSTCSVK